MWKEISIEKKDFFIECKMVKNDVSFMLYDLKESWCEKVEMSDVVTRAKELNKRIQFDKLTILDTLISGKAVEAQLEADDDVAKSKLTLRLKYRIDGMPFHFKWQLVEQKEQEFRVAVTLPLFEAVHGMREEIEELLEVIAKKDKEIKQYKDDGAILRITTVATQPFNFIDFNKKYAEINEISKGFEQIGNVLKQQSAKEKQSKEKEENGTASTNEMQSQSEQKQVIKQQLTNKSKKSPRSKKRKVQDIQQKRMAQRLNAKKQKLEYESSQSQSFTDSPPPSELDDIGKELLDINKSWMELEKQRLLDLNCHSDSSLND